MIPLSLTIEGLYSYKEKQTINFETLTSNGLFGIFGEVGSGKSSILEAIMFVLFDDTERLNKSGDDRYYNMLNLQSNRFHIDFTFMSGKGNQEKYRFACMAKRNSKADKFEEVKISKNDRQYYRWEGEQWLPLEGVKDASEILGMDYKNFKQTIIIPQGKFREFVDQTSGDRTRMLKELFRLHSFDLGPQTGSLLKKTEMDIQHVQGQLESLGEVKQEEVTRLGEEIKQLEGLIKELQEKTTSHKKEEQELKALEQLHEQLLECRQRLKTLEAEGAKWKEREQQLKTYTEAYTHFYEKLRQQHSLGKELKEKAAAQQELEKKLKQNKEQQQKAKETFEQARTAYEQKDQVARKIEDLERTLQLKATEEKLAAIQKVQAKQTGDCEKLEAQKKQSKEQYLAMEERLQKLEAGQPDIGRLSEVFQWVEKKETFLEQIKKAEAALESCKESLKTSQQQQKQLLQDWPALSSLEDWPAVLSGLEEMGRSLLEQEAVEDKKLRELHVQQKLTEYADQLQKGQACPLCGATDHPQLAVSEHIAQACEEQEQKIKQCREKQQQLNQLNANLKEVQANLRHLEQNHQQQEKDLQQFRQQQQLLEHNFSWPEFRQTEKEELKRQIDLAKLAAQQIKTFKTQLATAKKEAEHKADKYETLSRELQQTERQLSSLQGEWEAKKEALHADNQRLLKFETAALQESLQKGKEKLEKLIKHFEHSQQQINQLNEHCARLQATFESGNQTIQELQQKQEALQQEIEELCRTRGFSNQEKVREVLALRLNIEEEDRQIKQYYQQLHIAHDRLQKLEEQVAGRPYDKEAHTQLLEKIRQQEEQCEEHKKRQTQAAHEKADKEDKLKKSGNLLKELEALELRRENLKELAGLFRGSGFVDYVSTIYLQDLCRVANERFFKLTRNNLSLELDGQNNFIVRDFLNGGRTRLLKTLSGGQTFQAALCLALAMAENIKSLNEAEQSFFFLDEGFGALDKESLRIVFDTLKSLRHENRIVGIISHVEELQQEIEVFLKVENDAEKGSLVSCSWE
ncbi:AAA family ATPase [Nafulsella turpanensis]|uniref:AAA family ATPase n=1 Tax=Nafulsella turpanensis TaxID=1265690 RepID=UPI000348F784|nr:SMC family ATPase [Nafulsella turpanensis]